MLWLVPFFFLQSTSISSINYWVVSLYLFCVLQNSEALLCSNLILGFDFVLLTLHLCQHLWSYLYICAVQFMRTSFWPAITFYFSSLPTLTSFLDFDIPSVILLVCYKLCSYKIGNPKINAIWIANSHAGFSCLYLP